MPQILIKRGDKTPLTPHFNTSEFYSNSPDAPLVHNFPSELVAAAEYLRNHYGQPWRITSTYRTAAHERRILAMLDVPFFVDVHMLSEAFDSQPAVNASAIMADLAHQFLTGGEVFKELRRLGVNGFGLYDTFIHLDVRKSKAPHTDEFGQVAHWDSRSSAHRASDKQPSPWGVAFANQKKSPVAAG